MRTLSKEVFFLIDRLFCSNITRDLSKNSLRVFDTSEIQTLGALKTLNLADNSIFHMGALPASNMTNLDLTGNPIKTLDPRIIDELATSKAFKGM